MLTRLVFFLSLVTLLMVSHSLHYRKLVLLKFALFCIFISSLFLPQFHFHIVFLHLLCVTVKILLFLKCIWPFQRNYSTNKIVNVLKRYSSVQNSKSQTDQKKIHQKIFSFFTIDIFFCIDNLPRLFANCGLKLVIKRLCTRQLAFFQLEK